MSAEYRKSNQHFTFHNENPKHQLRVGDCVIRALGYANDGWDNAYKELCDIGFELKCTPTEKIAFEQYLKNHGWIKHKQPRTINNKKYTVEELTELNECGIVIVTVSGHMTVIEDNKIIDSWDCGACCVCNYWSTICVDLLDYILLLNCTDFSWAEDKPRVCENKWII